MIHMRYFFTGSYNLSLLVNTIPLCGYGVMWVWNWHTFIIRLIPGSPSPPPHPPLPLGDWEPVNEHSPPPTPRNSELCPWPEVYAIRRSSATRRTQLLCLSYGWYFKSNFLVQGCQDTAYTYAHTHTQLTMVAME